MIIGKFDSFIVNTGNNNCVCPKDSKYCRYTASTGGYQVTGYGVDCKGAIADWNKLASRKHYTLPAAKGGNPGLSGNSQAIAQGKTPYQPQVVKGNWISGSGGNTIAGVDAGVSASGKAGAGVTAGASVTATVSDIKAKTNQAVSDVLPDVIEDKLPANFPLWLLPVGLIGALALILIARR